jgi:hypothetical protein
MSVPLNRKTGTKVAAAGGIVSVKYHGTTVVCVNADGSIILNTGGWKTSTTKKRMNQAASQFGLGFYVWQDKGEWFAKRSGTVYPFGVNHSITLPA